MLLDRRIEGVWVSTRMRSRSKSPTSRSCGGDLNHSSLSSSTTSRGPSEEMPRNGLKKKPEPLSPRLFFFDKRSKQISPCSSRDPSPTPSPTSRSFSNHPHPCPPTPPPLIRGDLPSSLRGDKTNRPTSSSPRTKPQFTPSHLAVQLSRRDSDTLEALGEQIGGSQGRTAPPQSPTNQSKKIVQYCKQLSRTESQTDPPNKMNNIMRSNLQLDLTLQRNDDSEEEGNHNPAEISPPRTANYLPLSARQRSHRNLITSKSDSPSSQSARSLGSSESRVDPISPSVNSLIEYSKTLVRLTSSDTIADITKDRVAYANHALRFAQTTLNSPLPASTKKSEEFSEESLYSSLMKSQTLLAHYNPSDDSTALKDSNPQIPSPQVTVVKEFQSRPSTKFLPRMKSWSPSPSASSPGFARYQSKDSTHKMRNRPMSSSRYLTSHSFSDHFVGSDSDEDIERANGEIKVRPRKTLVKRYAKNSSDATLRDSPEYIQTQLDAMGSDIVYNFEDDFLNE